jgi:hypothetical protein
MSSSWFLSNIVFRHIPTPPEQRKPMPVACPDAGPGLSPLWLRVAYFLLYSALSRFAGRLSFVTHGEIDRGISARLAWNIPAEADF